MGDNEDVGIRRTFLVAACALLALPASAQASQLIARNAKHIHLAVDRDGHALLTYDLHGATQHVVAWGAVNARAPRRDGRQVAFKVDYSGGYGAFGRPLWKTLRNACKPYHPGLRWVVAACTAPDGSHWAVQVWRRLMPNGGSMHFTGDQGKWELHLSHWKGPLPSFWLKMDWVRVNVNGHIKYVDHFFGQLSYLGKPVFGYSSTPAGNPTDSWGTLVWLDTLNSPWGSGWRRLNSFLTHRPYGNFCAFAGRLWGHKTFGMGSAYRAYVEGPGVTPVLFWQHRAPGEYDHDLDVERAAENHRLIHDDRTDGCFFN